MNSPLPPPPLSFDHDDIIGGSTGRRRRRNKNRNTNNPLHSIQFTIDNICTQLNDKLSQCNTQLRNNQLLPPPHILLPSVISGTLAFYATSFSSQYIQYKLLKLSTGTRPMIIPISVGVATVAMGSWMGHLAGLGTVAAATTATAKCTDMSSSSSSRMQWNRRATPDFLEQCNSLLEEKILPMKDAACRTVHEMTRPMTIATTTNNNNNRRMQQERKEA
eukprot:scaffold6265_cov120-Skeletonema_marinoi.AAC.1